VHVPALKVNVLVGAEVLQDDVLAVQRRLQDADRAGHVPVGLVLDGVLGRALHARQLVRTHLGRRLRAAVDHVHVRDVRAGVALPRLVGVDDEHVLVAVVG